MISTPTVSHTWIFTTLITPTPPALQQTQLAVLAGRMMVGIVSALFLWQFMQAGGCQLHVYGRRLVVVCPPQAKTMNIAKAKIGSEMGKGTIFAQC